MNKLEKRQQIALILGGTLLLAGLFWYFMIGAQNGAFEKVSESIRELEDRIYKAEMRRKRGPAVEAELSELREKIAEAESQMIPYEQLNGNKWLLDTVTRFIHDQYQIVPTRLSSDPQLGKQFVLLPKFSYSGAAFDLELRGFFHEFGRFLADFENRFPYIRVHDLQMSPLATPSAATGPAPDLQEELLNTIDREQLRISLKLVVLYKPLSTP